MGGAVPVRWRLELELGVGLDNGWRADRASRRVSTRQAESPRHEERVQFWSEAAVEGEGFLRVGRSSVLGWHPFAGGRT